MKNRKKKHHRSQPPPKKKLSVSPSTGREPHWLNVFSIVATVSSYYADSASDYSTLCAVSHAWRDVVVHLDGLQMRVWLGDVDRCSALRANASRRGEPIYKTYVRLRHNCRHMERLMKLFTSAPPRAVAIPREMETFMPIACEMGDMSVVAVFLAIGVDKNAMNNDGKSHLNVACENGHLDIATALLAAGADTNSMDRIGDTALLIASKKGHFDIVTALLAAGADTNASNRIRQTPLLIACEKGHRDIAIALHAAGADTKRPHPALSRCTRLCQRSTAAVARVID